jgi:Arc/MetJ-type ribon-helix-helix transcriptional regulator
MSTVTIRTDDETDAALAALTRGGRSRSEAVRDAILLAYRQETSARLRAEAEAAAADPEDLAEVRAIREELDAPGAW